MLFCTAFPGGITGAEQLSIQVLDRGCLAGPHSSHMTLHASSTVRLPGSPGGAAGTPVPAWPHGNTS